jgi:hypothetical protein
MVSEKKDGVVVLAAAVSLGILYMMYDVKFLIELTLAY